MRMRGAALKVVLLGGAFAAHSPAHGAVDFRLIVPDKDGVLDFDPIVPSLGDFASVSDPIVVAPYTVTRSIGTSATVAGNLRQGILKARVHSPDTSNTCDVSARSCTGTEATQALGVLSDQVTFDYRGPGPAPATIPVTFWINLDGMFSHGAEGGATLGLQEYAQNFLGTSFIITRRNAQDTVVEEAQYFFEYTRTSNPFVAGTVEDSMELTDQGSFGFDEELVQFNAPLSPDGFEGRIRLTYDYLLGEPYDFEWGMDVRANEYGFFARDASVVLSTTTDYLNTGVLALELPDNVTFESASGNFLTAASPAPVPAPASLWLLLPALLMLAGRTGDGRRLGVRLRRS